MVEQTIKDFFASYPVKHLGKGQSILRPGDEVKKVNYLISGSVVQYDISPAGNTVVLNVYKPGTFFPMSCVLNDQPNWVTTTSTPDLAHTSAMPAPICPAPITPTLCISSPRLAPDA